MELSHIPYMVKGTMNVNHNQDALGEAGKSHHLRFPKSGIYKARSPPYPSLCGIYFPVKTKSRVWNESTECITPLNKHLPRVRN